MVQFPQFKLPPHHLQQHQEVTGVNGSLRKLLKHLRKALVLAHQNFIHIICYVLHRMGIEHIEANVWAKELRDVIQTKAILKADNQSDISQVSDYVLMMAEESRNSDMN